MDKEIYRFKIFAKNLFSEDKGHVLSSGIDNLIEEHSKKIKITEGYDQKYMEELYSFQSIPEESYSSERFIDEIETKLIPHTTNTASPYFMGHMTSALPNFTATMSTLVTSLNQNLVKVETAQAATFYEKQTLAMLHELIYNNSTSFYEEHIHKKDSTLGIITSGGTIANITALQCARNISLGQDIEAHGITSNKIENTVVICSELGHYSIKKALGVLGLGKKNLIKIPIDENNKICLKTLESTLKSCQKNNVKVMAIIGIAGSTECGSVDPLEKMAELAEKHKVYFHVDAAWGGAVLFSGKHKHLLKGIEKADSVTIDGHKQFYLPMGIGMLLFKTPYNADLIQNTSEYIIRKDSIDLGKKSLEGSRPFQSLYLQAGFKLIGKKKYGFLIDNGIYKAKMMADLLDKKKDFEVLVYPETNILLYRYIPKKYRGVVPVTEEINFKLNDFNKNLQQKQMQRGKTFVSHTTTKLKKYQEQPIVGLRVVIANPLIEKKHMKAILKEQRKLALKIEKGF